MTKPKTNVTTTLSHSFNNLRGAIDSACLARLMIKDHEAAQHVQNAIDKMTEAEDLLLNKIKWS